MIIGLVGRKQHGKSTVANHLVEQHGFIQLNFADALRDVVRTLNPYVRMEHDTDPTLDTGEYRRYNALLNDYGYERAKAFPEVRRLLQVLGTEVGRDIIGLNIWVDIVLNRVATIYLDSTIEPDIVIADVRFENEIDAVKQLHGKVIRVTRPGYGGTADPHVSEKFADLLPVDATIVNESSLGVLKSQVDEVLAKLQERQ